MKDRDLADATWETIAMLSVDAASVAFGDPAILGEGWVLVGDQAAKAQPGSLVVWVTRVDMSFPVEVVRDARGVHAARMAFREVDDPTGSWKPSGELDLNSGRCMAADPRCSDREGYRVYFEVIPGRYAVEIYEAAAEKGGFVETLGLRIRLVTGA